MLKAGLSLTGFVLIFGAISARAEWQMLGPFGGAAEAVVVSPEDSNTLVAATRNALLYRSKDAGEHWASIAFPAHSFSVRVMKVSNAAQPVYFLGGVATEAWETGLYRSSDGGDSWQPVPSLPAKAVYSLAIWTKDPNVVAAGCDSGVYLSEDAGATWTRISQESNREMRYVTSLAIDPASRDVIYAGTAHLPWKTEDGGASWASIRKGMLDDSDVFSIEIDPSNTLRVVASACSGIYLSENGGASWVKVLGVPNTSRRTYTIRRDPAHLQTLYAGTSQGLWKSENGGVKWAMVSSALVKSIAFDPDRDTFYLATENNGLLRSADQGKSFQFINNGFVNRNLKSLAASKTGLLAASPYDNSGGNIYQMSFAGVWVAVKPPAGVKPANLLSVSSSGGASLLGINSSGSVRTADGGKTWVRVTGERGRVHAIHAISGAFLMGTDQGMFRSEDAGLRWKTVLTGTAVTGIYSSGQRVVADAGKTLFLSEDGGLNWDPAISPVAPGELYGIARGMDRTILAATAHGAFRSTDGGHTWAPIPQLAGTVRAIVFDPSGKAAVAIRSDAVYRSSDGGETWSALDMRGIQGTTILALVIPDAQPDKVFAATLARGIFVSSLAETIAQSPGTRTETAALKINGPARNNSTKPE
jgi:photosystem II stability/assembly factor-like uncharacterized protein